VNEETALLFASGKGGVDGGIYININQNSCRPLIQQKNEPELLPGQYQMLIRVLPSAHALARSEVAGYWLLDLPAQHRGGRLLTRIAIAIGVFE
jgi:hypothetical protein